MVSCLPRAADSPAPSSPVPSRSMMDRNSTLDVILRERVIGIVRLHDAAPVVPVVEAIHEGGVHCIEVSLTTPGALDGIREIRARNPELLIGAGTVCSEESAAAAIEAGARFLVTPVTIPTLIGIAHSAGLPIAMGAFTPTEAHAAHGAGADLVKLFPASSLTPGYLRALLAPLPDLRLVPTGGVNAENAAEWLRAGAVALGVGGGLTATDAVAARRFDRLTDYARRLMQSLDAAGSPPESTTTSR